MQITVWLFVFVIGVAQGTFLTAALLTMKTGNRRATIILAAMVAVFTLMILVEAIDHTVHLPIELLITGASINTELAIGPLLLLFVRSVLNPDRPFMFGDVRHFLTLLIGLVFWLVVTAAMYLELVDLTESEFYSLIAGFVVFKAVFLFCYISVAYRTLADGRIDSSRFVAGRKHVDMKWLQHWLVALALVAGFIYSVFFLGFFGVSLPESDDVGSLVLALLIYLVSFFVLVRPWILSAKPRKADRGRYVGDIQRLQQYLEEERRFLDPELTAATLADALGITEKHLSAVLNDGMQTSFYQLVARFRLAEFERLAREPHNRGRSVLDMAYAAGFNSKASFYRLFRRSHGTTPTAYLEQVTS